MSPVVDDFLAVDPQARQVFVEQLARDGSVTDYLLRLRRADETPIWVEVTAQAKVTTSKMDWSAFVIIGW